MADKGATAQIQMHLTSKQARIIDAKVAKRRSSLGLQRLDVRPSLLTRMGIGSRYTITLHGDAATLEKGMRRVMSLARRVQTGARPKRARPALPPPASPYRTAAAPQQPPPPPVERAPAAIEAPAPPPSPIERRLAHSISDHEVAERQRSALAAPLREELSDVQSNPNLRRALGIKSGTIVLGVMRTEEHDEYRVLELAEEGLRERIFSRRDSSWSQGRRVDPSRDVALRWADFTAPKQITAAVGAWAADFPTAEAQVRKLIP